MQQKSIYIILIIHLIAIVNYVSYFVIVIRKCRKGTFIYKNIICNKKYTYIFIQTNKNTKLLMYNYHLIP